MRIAMLAPIAWRTPPRHYGPWENIASLLTEGLVKKGVDVTLFATKDSQTSAKLESVCPRGYEEDNSINPKVWESLHISELFEKSERFDLIHNHFDFLPLTFIPTTSTPVLTTIHGFSSPEILPVYEKYNEKTYYVSISNADRNPKLNYIRTVYHGIPLNSFTFEDNSGDYLLFFGRMHHDKGAKESIEIARRSKKKLIMAGIIQDKKYFREEIEPFIDGIHVLYEGSVGPKKRDRLLREAYALLHPINFDEPFGLSVIESMACGTPVLAFDRGSMSEVISRNRTGFLVSSIEEAVDKVEEIKDLKRLDCRKWVEEKFSLEKMVENYISVYKSVLSKNQEKKTNSWGYSETLNRKDKHEIKKIALYPGQSLNVKFPLDKEKTWFIMEGKACIRKNGKEVPAKSKQSIYLSPMTSHEIKNIGEKNLFFIEIGT